MQTDLDLATSDYDLLHAVGIELSDGAEDELSLAFTDKLDGEIFVREGWSSFAYSYGSENGNQRMYEVDLEGGDGPVTLVWHETDYGSVPNVPRTYREKGSVYTEDGTKVGYTRTATLKTLALCSWSVTIDPRTHKTSRIGKTFKLWRVAATYDTDLET